MSSVVSSRATLTSGSRQLPRSSDRGFSKMGELQQLAKKDDRRCQTDRSVMVAAMLS